MKTVRRAMALVVLAVLAFGAAYAAGAVDRVDLWSGASSASPGEHAVADPTVVEPTVVETADTPEPTPEPEPTPKSKPEPEPKPEPELTPGPRLLGEGDSGDAVRDLQARLRQIAWFNRDVTGYYGPVTAAAVHGFQAKRGFPATGEVDRRTLDRLHEMTREPAPAELVEQPETNAAGTLDERCRTGRVLCIDKTTRTLRWVTDGRVHTTVDVRFGRESMPTREGSFQVFAKSRDHVSSIYDTSMPYAMFFSGGQAVHYSPDFAANGYNGASHGCVNVRDRGAIAALFDQVSIGDRVVVYWS